MQVQLQPAYILHTRPYRDTSLLIEALTPGYGRISLVGRGQRQSRQKSRRPLQPFTELLLSWQGRSDLKTLVAAEIAGRAAFLSGYHLFSGLYANELLTRLLPQGDAHPEVYATYQQLLAELIAESELEGALRRFEFRLLEELGYGIEFRRDARTDDLVEAGQSYVFAADLGVMRAEHNHSGGFAGEDLLAIAAEDYSRSETRRTAKRLARMALAPHLGNRPLKSRELFR
ncbi:DNA repair protein RecO [Gilvimarinus sp. F26214L]|uniref:DNA repair protein RecO n=1 Tax=Gilvimarinus sp. DZF01 TaxID=3461371 RepID=UPI004045C08B